jgi:hypothetical protein
VRVQRPVQIISATAFCTMTSVRVDGRRRGPSCSHPMIVVSTARFSTRLGLALGLLLIHERSARGGGGVNCWCVVSLRVASGCVWLRLSCSLLSDTLAGGEQALTIVRLNQSVPMSETHEVPALGEFIQLVESMSVAHETRRKLDFTRVRNQKSRVEHLQRHHHLHRYHPH